MKGHLAQKHKVNVTQKKVGNALRSVALNYHARHQTDTARHVNSVPYRADYFGYKLHVDQNEKFEIYGLMHVVAIDGHYRYITFGVTVPRKNNKVIYAEVYRLLSVLYLSRLFFVTISTEYYYLFW